MVDVTSGMEMAGGGALFAGGGSAEGAEHAVEFGIADAEPVLLADEMMAQMILLDPAAEPRARLVGNMGDVMHPLTVQDRQHHPEQRGRRGLRSEHQREQSGRRYEVRQQKPDRQEQQVQPARLDMV